MNRPTLRIKHLAAVAAAVSVLLAAAGCATDAPPSDKTASPAALGATSTSIASAARPVEPKVQSPQQIGEARLAAGIALYDKGDYNGALQVLQGTPEIWMIDVDTRTQAYKYVAFSYCLSNRRQPCRNAFDELLKLSPAFELSKAENGHPMWGPVFKQAKRDNRSAAKAHPHGTIPVSTPTK